MQTGLARLIARIVEFRRPLVVAIHAGLVALAYLAAFLIRFEFRLSAGDWEKIGHTIAFVVAVRLAIFAWFRLHEGLWRYVGVHDMVAIIRAVTIGSLIMSAGVLWFYRQDYPRSVLLLDWLLCIALVGGIRLGVRVFREAGRHPLGKGRRAVIVGAGDAAEMLLREIERNPSLDFEVVGFVDDSQEKQRRRIHAIEVLGTIDQLPDLCEARQVREVLIAIPSATGEQMRRIIGLCRSAHVEFRTLPSVGELMDDGVALSRVRPVQVADLLRRAPIRIDRAQVEGFILGKRVLVTGAGGSIGSELCRQLAAFAPATMVLLDRAENGLFFVEMELRDRHPALLLVSVIADVTDESRIDAVFREHKPQVVFHAAAHKHVPLMESNQAEAVKNNVLGTMTMANAAWRAGVEDFVMISTDKAVRPSSVMGATKRVAEMFVQSLNTRAKTHFMTVRFGNVLGSEGSVLQVFQRQIEAGGPVTVTHPDMMRYFMTIPEACQLVLQAATQGEGGEIFLLDMGEPVRIVDLARDLITLMGREPDKDIEITFTGVRPGEKMFEELLNPETRVVPTKHEKIVVMETTPVDYDRLEAGIGELVADAKAGREEALVPRLHTLVPEYRSNGDYVHAPSGTRSRILLAAPDAYTRSTLRRILENGYDLAEADSRRQLIEKLDECAPHLVILDATLPTMSIRRLCARIKNGNGHPPPSIILIAESAEAASLDQVRALGADDRLYRPIPVSVVEKRVRGLLGGREAAGR